jgi:hypothetical protein
MYHEALRLLYRRGDGPRRLLIALLTQRRDCPRCHNPVSAWHCTPPELDGADVEAMFAYFDRDVWPAWRCCSCNIALDLAIGGDRLWDWRISSIP